MDEQNMNKDSIAAYTILIGMAFILPTAFVWLGYWLWHVSLPTLMFISFILLFFGAFFCYPIQGRQQITSEAVVLLILGQSTGMAVLVLFLIRLYFQGMLFTWM